MGIDLTWPTFVSTMLEPGVPALHRIGGSETTELFVDAGARRIGLWLKMQRPPDSELSAKGTVRVASSAARGGWLIEVSTAVPSLYQQFFVLADDIATRVQAGNAPDESVQAAMRAWRDLLRANPGLSIEEQAGLWGELWFLDWLVEQNIPTALECWVGAQQDTHDFRVGAHDLEVKTTLAPMRRHWVSSLQQMSVAPQRSLWLVSILVASDPQGESLASKAMRILSRLGMRGRDFEERLSAVGVDLAELGSGEERFALRAPVHILPIDQQFPALTRERARIALGDQTSTRLLEAKYLVDVEGLGTALEELNAPKLFGGTL